MLSFILLPLYLTADLATTANSAETLTESIQAKVERIVVTGERTPTNAKHSLLSIGVLDQELLTQINQQHIQQALNRVPGVQFHRNDGQEYLAAIRSPVLTGASLENNVPIRPAGFCNVNELSETHHEFAHRIEVLRGPAMAFYGANALHGAVNVLTPAVLTGAGMFTMQVGENDFTNTTIAVQRGNFSAGISLLHDNGWRNDASVDQQKLSVAHTATLDQWRINTSMTATHLQQETAGFISGENAYKDRAQARRNDNPEAFRNSESLRLIQQWRSSDEFIITPYLRYSEMQFLQHFLPGQPVEQNGHWSTGMQTQKTFSLGAEHYLIVGLDAEYADIYLKEWQNKPTEGSAFLRATIPVGFHYDYSVRTQQVAPFFHWQYQSHKPLTWIAGLRYDYIHYDYDNHMLSGRTKEDGTPCGFDGCRFNRPESRQDQFNLWSPKLGLIYQLDTDHRLSALLNHGFRPPQTTELYRLQRAQTIAKLDAEEILGLELQWQAQWWQQDQTSMRTEISAYAYEKDHMILRNTDFFNIAEARTEHRGIESLLEWHFNNEWQWILSMTWQEHRYQNNPGISVSDIVGNSIDTAPKYFGFTALSFIPSERTRVELSLRYDDGYFTDAENEHRYEGHLITDLRLQHQVSKALSVSFHLLNIGDRAYAERADFAGFSGSRYIPGAPRSAYLGMTLNW